MASPADSTAHDVKEAFRARFQAEPRLYRAPGRVNLIGEHTDYNDGFVLPIAIDRGVIVAIAPRTDRVLRLHSLSLDETAQVSLDEMQPQRRWSDYVAGVARELEGVKPLQGADIVIGGSLPMGAGLSASAALEVGVACALAQMNGIELSLTEVALLCQRAENEFVGARCGVMDQFISCHGVAGHALLLDCRSLEARTTPIDPRLRIVIANSMVRHEIANSGFNERRAECEAVMRALVSVSPEIKALRDVSLPQLEQHAGLLSQRLLRRARHVVAENTRVRAAAAALEAGDASRFGELMNASHASLRDDYEVSCPEVDLLVDLSQKTPGVYGARMTGGGFGGCTVSLVEAEAVDRYRNVVGGAYEAATGVRPTIFWSRPAPGVGPVV